MSTAAFIGGALADNWLDDIIDYVDDVKYELMGRMLSRLRLAACCRLDCR